MDSEQAPPGWVTHQDPMGFSVQLPRGWTVRPDQSSGRVEMRGPGGEQLVVWPVFVNGSLGVPTAAETLRRVTTKLWPDVTWQKPQPAAATAVRSFGRSGDRAAVSALTWVTSPRGTAGYIYAMAAPPSSYRQAEATFAQILQSFRIAGVGSAGSQGEQIPSLEYVSWQDPREGSFILDVPRGWRVDGGLFRINFSVVDVRGAVQVTSPDGQIRITAGDAKIPIFMEPISVVGINYPEGTWYHAGYGLSYYVRRYVPGLAFAREYVQAKAAGGGCPDLKFMEEGARDREDAVRVINAVTAQWAGMGINARTTAGEVAFTCPGGGRLLRGYYFAATGLAQTQVGNWWRPNYLYGYLAADGKEKEAQAVLERMLKSFRANPQWVEKQTKAIAQSAEIVARTNQEISNIISDSYWKRAASQEEISRRGANARRGVDEVEDRETGRRMTVESGSNYYWVDAGGTIIGTETATRPNVDFRELIRLP